LTVLGANFNDYRLGIAENGMDAPCDSEVQSQLATARGNFDCSAVANAVTSAIRQLPVANSEPELWVAIPPALDPTALGSALQHWLHAGIRAQGFVDSAAVLAATLPVSHNVLLLDIAQQRTTISVVVMHADAAELRRSVVLVGGIAALINAWVRLAATTLVQQTRFDPLHNLQSESQLRAKLPAMARQAHLEGRGKCQIESSAESHALQLSRDQFAAASAELLRPIGTTLQALAAVLGDCSLLVCDTAAEIPGMEEVVATAQLPNAYVVPASAIARAASLLPRAHGANASAVQYLTRVQRTTAAGAAMTMMPLRPSAQHATTPATHIVYQGRALAISEAGIVLGRDATDELSLRLPEGLAGVSRRHCTIRRDAGRSVVIDHSSYGTFVDGVRVRGRALLSAGATLRVGDPGLEFPLVTLDALGA
jgi:FHA domain